MGVPLGGQLPQVPEAIDHAVMGPEEGVVGGDADVLHRPADPDMDPVVDSFELVLKAKERAVTEYLPHGLPRAGHPLPALARCGSR